LPFFTGCFDLPTELKIPEWDVDINLPIVDRYYTLDDIIGKQEYVSISGAGNDSIYVIQSDKYEQSTDVRQFAQASGETSLTGIPILASSKTDTSIALFVPVPDGAEMVKAEFESGYIKFHVINPTSVKAYITIACPGFTRNNEVLSFPIIANPGDNQLVQYSVAGYSYNLPINQQVSNQDKIQIIVMTSLPNGPDLSFLFMDVYISEFYFHSVSGYLPPKSLGVKTNAFEITLGKAADYRDKVKLKSSNLNLNINYLSQFYNPFGVELKNVNIIGRREDGKSIYLTDSTGSKDINIKLDNDFYSYCFTQNNSNVNSFISFLPKNVVLNAEYIMNPDSSTGAVSVNDSVKFSADFTTTACLAFSSSTVTDTSSLNITDQDSAKIKDSKSAYLTISILNGIALNASIKITLLDKQKKTLFTLTNGGSSNPDFSFSPAEVDENGDVIKPASSEQMLMLDSLQTRMLSSARFATYSVTLYTNTSENNAGSKASFVTIRPNDKIKVKVYGGVKYHVNKDDWD